MNRRRWTIFTALLLIALLAVPAAAAERPDFSRTGSISVTIKDQDGRPVTGGSLEMICVALAVRVDGNDRFEYTEEFAGCTEKLDDDGITRNGSPRLAAALKKFADSKGISGETQDLDSEGMVKYGDLKLGLYLIAQKNEAEGYSSVEPFLVSIPFEEEGKLIYDVNATPKPAAVTTSEGETEPHTTEPGTEPSTEPPTTKTPPDIPQTGQLWWPVPLFASIGAVLVLLGVFVRRGKKEKK